MLVVFVRRNCQSWWRSVTHHSHKAKEEVVGEAEDVVVVVQSLRIKWLSLLLISCKNLTHRKHMKVFYKRQFILLDSHLSLWSLNNIAYTFI